LFVGMCLISVTGRAGMVWHLETLQNGQYDSPQPVSQYFFERFYLVQKDTVTSGLGVAQNAKFVIPAQFAQTTFEFQVNAEITYHTFDHFVKDEGRETFYRAWTKEQEQKRIVQETDSMRKVYATASNEQKEAMAVLILNNEKKVIALSEEFPGLYQSARDLELQFWQAASQDEKVRFQEKIKIFRDSVNQISGKSENAVVVNEVPDTMFVYTPPTTLQETKSTEETGIVYKIQLGAFKGKTPDVAEKALQKLAVLRKVENYKDEKGMTIYTTGSLRVYGEAEILRDQVKQEGMKNPIIIAFQNGKRTTVQEARKLNNEL
jgi:hypothetical protein